MLKVRGNNDDKCYRLQVASYRLSDAVLSVKCCGVAVLPCCSL